MKLVAAYLLAVLGGNTAPTADDLKSILGSVGADADDAMIELLLSQAKGRDVAELIAIGMEKMAASVPSGGGGAAVAAPADGGSGGGAPVAVAAKKEEEVVEEGESDDEMCLDLFG
ncbi:60S acidic ribosomal protein P2 [Linum perenne]